MLAFDWLILLLFTVFDNRLRVLSMCLVSVAHLNVFTWQGSAAKVCVEGSPVPMEERATPTEPTGSSACALWASGAPSVKRVSGSSFFDEAANTKV